MKIQLRMLTCMTYTVDVFETDQIVMVKQTLLERYGRGGLSIGQIWLVYKQKELQDSMTVKECGLEEGSIVAFVIRAKEEGEEEDQNNSPFIP